MLSVYAPSIRPRSSGWATGFRRCPARSLACRPVDLFEYQGKQFFAGFDIPVSPGEARHHGRRRGRRRRPDRLSGRGQGPGPGRRSGQGRRRQAGQRRRRGPRARRATSSASTSRVTSSRCLDRAGLRHRRGVLRQLHAGPGGQEAPRACCRPRAAWRSRRSPTRTPTPSPRSAIDPVDGLTEERRPGLGRRPPS